ncbi:hypothetical protein [Halopiger goleimassiliensis]|uniref:hypothetical protein n=1 Tax=Halopiger goleimassiliensis TaxID=1293048 RepID=UPI000677E162|nr:hypothetical protein [Halopiger goleimassiliensis]
MRWFHRPFAVRLEQFVVGLLALGAGSGGLWLLGSRLAPSHPVVEIPAVMTVTWLLGAGSLYVTVKAPSALREQIDQNAVTGPGPIETVGVAVVGACLVLSGVAFLNAAAYFALERQWPITPAQVGQVQFWLLAGLVLTPVVTSALTGVWTLTTDSR